MIRIIRGTLIVTTGVLLTTVLAAQNGTQAPLPREAAIQIDARPAAGATTIQAPAAQSQAPAIQLDQTNPSAAQTPLINVDVTDTSLSLLLSQIAQQSGLNLAMPQNLDREVSVNLKDATLATALEAMLPPEGLQYQIDGKLLKVFRPQMVTATLNFNYITTVRTRSTSLSASATAGFSGGGAGGLSGGGGGGGVAGGSSTSISGSENTDLPTKVEEMIRAMGTKGEGADIQYNKMLGQFFIRDYPENIARMKSILDQTQNAAGMQVYIEARLVEVQLNKTSQSGVNWSLVLGNAFSFSSSLAQQSAFQATISHKGFDAMITALSTYGDVNVLSNPTVTTLNGQPAVVRIGTQDVFFITQTQTDPRTGQIIQTAETPATVNEGVVLDVTPNISPDGVIYMNIHPVVTERTGQATSARGSTVPILDLRESDTAVHVRDGDTIVIAGLISEKNLKNTIKSPLASIPVIGGLFKSKKDEVKKTDLVIMLTPRLFPLSRVPEMTRERLQIQEQSRLELEKESGAGKK
jgi:MSHA biogenesis protein MshL